MKAQGTQGSFITVIWTLIAKVKEVTGIASVPIHPRVDVVSDLLLQPLVSRSIQRRLVEEARLSPRVYRFSSSDNFVPPGWSGSPSRLFSR
jgi:hypothetical protein